MFLVGENRITYAPRGPLPWKVNCMRSV